MKTLTVASLFLFLVSSTNAGAQVKVGASNQRQSIDCKGQAVRVVGSSNTLTLSGKCGPVEIEGSDNVLSIEAVDDIAVVGQRNRVTWQRTITDRKSPSFAATGPGNTMTKATVQPAAATEDRAAAPALAKNVPAPAAPARRALSKAWSVEGNALRLSGDGQSERADCDGRDVVILGNSNKVTLVGECGLVTVPGTSNTIDVEAAQRIRSEGNNNEFTWHRILNGREPEASLLGRKNTIKKQGA